jgi:hypothetical protein
VIRLIELIDPARCFRPRVVVLLNSAAKPVDLALRFIEPYAAGPLI